MTPPGDDATIPQEVLDRIGAEAHNRPMTDHPTTNAPLIGRGWVPVGRPMLPPTTPKEGDDDDR